MTTVERSQSELEPIGSDVGSRLGRIEGVVPNLATKADVEGVKGVIPNLATKADVEGVKGVIPNLATKADVEAVKGDVAVLQTDVNTLKADMTDLRASQRWLMGLVVSVLIAVLAMFATNVLDIGI